MEISLNRDIIKLVKERIKRNCLTLIYTWELNAYR